MADIDFELRMQLMRAQPTLSLSNAESLVRGVASGCLNLRDDAGEIGEFEHQDFFTFCQVDGVALAAVFRKDAITFFAFPADESFVNDSEKLAMNDVAEFLELARNHAKLSEDIAVPIARALPWMERHRSAER